MVSLNAVMIKTTYNCTKVTWTTQEAFRHVLLNYGFSLEYPYVIYRKKDELSYEL